MKNNFRLLTDMDDVLENLLENWLELLKFQQRNNPNYVHRTKDQITQWNMTELFPMLTVDEVFAPLNTDIIWDMIRPMEDAVRVLEKYNSMPNVDVRLLTSSHYSAIPAKREFLRKYFPFINWNQVIVAGHGEKVYVKGNVLVDDYQNNLIGGDYKGLLFESPHNASFDISEYPYIQRVKNWKEAEIIIDNMIKEYFQDDK